MLSAGCLTTLAGEIGTTPDIFSQIEHVRFRPKADTQEGDLIAMQQYTQSVLLNDLVGIFPEFSDYWRAEIGEDEFPSSSLHAVYMSFLPFLAHTNPTPKQWQLIADHFSEAVAVGGDRENAVATCVLEHLHQVRLNRLLRPLLSQEARTHVRT